MNLPHWTREPLVHFFAAGALVFAWFAWVGEPVDPTDRVIDVDREMQAQIALGFERMMNRPPTDAELDGLIDQYVREEVLYREALRLGFDRDDAVVRRRMAQKMNMAATASVETAQPSDVELHKWYEENAQRFAEEMEYSFDQLWFEEEEQASSGLAQLRGSTDWRQLEGGISLPSTMDRNSRRDVLANFGELFVTRLNRIEPNSQWQGPVPSGLGWHLVRLRTRTTGKVPPLDKIRDEVLDDWRTATISERKERAYRLLHDAYRIEIAR